MTRPFIPERFGCGEKLSLNETRKISETVRGPHSSLKGYSELITSGSVIVTSIDKIYFSGRTFGRFCELALRHAASDVICGFAEPKSVDVCFEFSGDLGESDRLLFCQEFFDAANRLNLSVGKCHSTFGDTPALTLAVQGEQFFAPTDAWEHGTVYLTGKLGGLKELYLDYMGIMPNQYDAASAQMLRSGLELVKEGASAIADVTDVSGFGLFGALSEIAHGRDCRVTVNLSDAMLFRPSLDDISPPCLQSASISDVDTTGLSPRWFEIGHTRELCGPLVILCSDGDDRLLGDASRRCGVNLLRVGTFDREKRGVICLET